MKVVFVGIHNKPDKLPLDSTTKTGAFIDEVIRIVNSRRPNVFEFEKTNLFNVEYLPKGKEKKLLIKEFISKISPNTFYIALGSVVSKAIQLSIKPRFFMSVKHPAYVMRAVRKKDWYIHYWDMISQIETFEEFDKNDRVSEADFNDWFDKLPDDLPF